MMMSSNDYIAMLEYKQYAHELMEQSKNDRLVELARQFAQRIKRPATVTPDEADDSAK